MIYLQDWSGTEQGDRHVSTGGSYAPGGQRLTRNETGEEDE